MPQSVWKFSVVLPMSIPWLPTSCPRTHCLSLLASNLQCLPGKASQVWLDMERGLQSTLLYICLFLKFNKTKLTGKWLHASQAWIQRRTAADLVQSVVISFNTLAQGFFCVFCSSSSDLALYCKYTQYSKIYTASVNIAMMPVTVLSTLSLCVTVCGKGQYYNNISATQW